MYEKVKPNLLEILDAAYKIQSYTQALENAAQFYADHKTFDAVLMNFVVPGEAANRLPKDFINTHSNIPWRSIAGFRNIIAHNYFGIDADEVWQIIQEQLPILIKQIAILASADESV